MTSPVIIASEANFGEDLRKLAIITGGVFALGVTERNYSTLIENVPLGGKLKIRIGLPVVFVSEEVADILSKEELAAIIAHEQGHIELGHLDGAVGLVNNEDCEFAADEYAASRHGAHNIIGAIDKLTDRFMKRINEVSTIANGFEFDIPDDVREVLFQQVEAANQRRYNNLNKE